MAFVVFFVASIALSCASTVATGGYVEPTEEQIGAISQNCASIKLQLQKVQKNDAKNRVHLGAQYEMISTKLMLNLNLRLVRENLADSELSSQQTSFASERERFKNDYIGYSQELETLIGMNCRSEPEQFYRQLEITRTKRAAVEQSVWRLNEILTTHRQSVLGLKERI